MSDCDQMIEERCLWCHEYVARMYGVVLAIDPPHDVTPEHCRTSVSGRHATEGNAS